MPYKNVAEGHLIIVYYSNLANYTDITNNVCLVHRQFINFLKLDFRQMCIA